MSNFPGSVIKLLVGIVLFVGLPWVGWGLMDFRGFIGHPVRLAYVVLVILLQIVVVMAFPTVGQGGGDGKLLVRRQRIAVYLLQVFSLAIVLVAPYSDHGNVAAFDEGAVVRYFGLALFGLGFIVMNWAEASLGKQFSIQVTLQQGHQLVTGGLYRYLRHPRYVGITVFNVGIALIYRSWLALVFVAVLAMVLLWRIHDEEQLMQQAFGAEWESYAKRSWRLMPFVY